LFLAAHRQREFRALAVEETTKRQDFANKGSMILGSAGCAYHCSNAAKRPYAHRTRPGAQRACANETGAARESWEVIGTVAHYRGL